MPVWLHNIETLVPETVYSQEYAGEKMQDFYDDPRTKRLIRAIYRKSGIVKRHSVVQNFLGGNAEGFFTKSPEGRTVEPTTAVRNEIFARESKRLSVALAKKVIDSCPGIGPKDITHVVTVSCTGFHNPGPDFHIVNELGISPTAYRYHLGFMGCYAGITGLRMATQFCLADPDAVALVLCLELCTLHLQLTGGEDSLMANSLFGDGAGAAIVSSWKPEGDGLLFQAGSFNSALVPDGEAEMTWTLGDRGFDMTLSSYVPKIIGSNIRELIEPVLAKGGMKLEDVGAWAVHPGGKAIIDRVQDSLGLHPEQVQSSREVLRQFGNMSSATILFVLEDILRHPPERNHQLVCALAFGPGLTVEMALLRASKNCE
jgi:predicted naringenin-chalcone synthase